jgi:hypothetical protein
MAKGQVVNVRLYGGAVAPRRVIADRGDVVVICSEEEYRTAEKEDREPIGLGFPRKDVIAEEPARKVASRAARTESAQAGD